MLLLLLLLLRVAGAFRRETEGLLEDEECGKKTRGVVLLNHRRVPIHSLPDDLYLPGDSPFFNS